MAMTSRSPYFDLRTDLFAAGRLGSGDWRVHARRGAEGIRDAPAAVALSARPPPSAAQGASVLGVIDAEDQNLIQLVPTFNVPAVGTGNNSTQHPAGTAHSVAVNAANNHVFVPLAADNAFPD